MRQLFFERSESKSEIFPCHVHFLFWSTLKSIDFFASTVAARFPLLYTRYLSTNQDNWLMKVFFRLPSPCVVWRKKERKKNEALFGPRYFPSSIKANQQEFGFRSEGWDIESMCFFSGALFQSATSAISIFHLSKLDTSIAFRLPIFKISIYPLARREFLYGSPVESLWSLRVSNWSMINITFPTKMVLGKKILLETSESTCRYHHCHAIGSSTTI